MFRRIFQPEVVFACLAGALFPLMAAFVVAVRY